MSEIDTMYYEKVARKEEKRADRAEEALREIRAELSHGLTCNPEFIERKFKEVLGYL